MAVVVVHSSFSKISWYPRSLFSYNKSSSLSGRTTSRENSLLVDVAGVAAEKSSAVWYTRSSWEWKHIKLSHSTSCEIMCLIVSWEKKIQQQSVRSIFNRKKISSVFLLQMKMKEISPHSTYISCLSEKLNSVKQSLRDTQGMYTFRC